MSTTSPGAEPSFARDIRPILAGKCFACHGPDEETREADLRLDDRAAAIELSAIVPGEPDESELIRRILTDDPDERMPPADSGEPLTATQQGLLRQWIADGAKYERHWGFVRPQRPQVPQAKFADRIENEIDNFIFARLGREGLSPSPEADRYTLARRVYLDLIGLPPTPEEADAFVADSDPRAYENLVDHLLASSRYGERWARDWLDLARYADTNGYEKDRSRSIWPFRDWVIRALNDDMPFDQFTIEQLAGDMLPEATADQRIATGFHRNTMLNEEGGIDPLEYRFYAMVDRVATTGTVWLGLTTGCAQCHSHKYDPISQTDYYRLMALLNNADEPDITVPDQTIDNERRQLMEQIEQRESELPDRYPLNPHERGGADLPVPDPEFIQEQRSADEQVAQSESEPPADALSKETEPDDANRRRAYGEQKLTEWLDAVTTDAVKWNVVKPAGLHSNLPRLEVLEDGSIFSSGDVTKRDVYTLTFPLDASSLPITALRLEVLPDERLPAGGPGRAYYEGRQGDFFLSELTAAVDGTPVPFASASHSYGKISIGSGSADAANVIDGDGSTGWSTAEREGQPSQLVLNLTEPLTAGEELTVELLFERHFAASLGRFRLSVTSAEGTVEAKSWPVGIEELLTRDAGSWTDDERLAIRRQYDREAPELAEARAAIDELRGRLQPQPRSMVLQERPADNIRPTFRHHRGEYLSPREPVEPGIPAAFVSGKSPRPSNRLELARWLVSPDNPLAARVAVNRAWQSMFGTGLVRTSGDFGTQAEPPSHPELLNWLAVTFVDEGWSLKKLHRLIVTSATYRQSSRVRDELAERDPENRLLARGPRFRMNAEIVRDAMLKSSGLLSPKMYGPSVYPPQPASVTALAYGAGAWNVSAGEDRYRRSLYTFSKRTAPFAAYAVFDAPTGETCVARRNRSNTPLQSLTLLNDEMFLEMARSLAGNAMEQPADAAEQIATFLFRRLLTRPPGPEELAAILEFQQTQQHRCETGELKANEIAAAEDASPERAAWVLVARALMNLDEAVTKS